MTVIIDKVIYIHIPKTGGRFVRSFVVNELGGEVWCKPTEHLAASEIGNKGKIFNTSSYTKIAFVRHPVEYLYSFWAFHADHHDGDGLWRRMYQTGYPPLVLSKYLKVALDTIVNDSLEKTITNITTKYPNFVGEFYDSFIDDTTLIGRQENLVENFISLTNDVNPNILKGKEEQLRNKKRVGVSVKPQPMTDTLRKMIIESEAYAIKKWGY